MRVEDVAHSWGLLLQSERSAPHAMMKYQTHSCTLITNGLTGNDDNGVWVQSSSLIVDYFKSSVKVSHAAREDLITGSYNTFFTCKCVERSLTKPSRRCSASPPFSWRLYLLFSFHQNSPANLKLLFLVRHVALGGRPNFTSDKKKANMVRLYQRCREMTTVAVGRISTDQNLVTFDLIFPQHLTGHYRLDWTQSINK